jgi:hypothetical protein
VERRLWPLLLLDVVVVVPPVLLLLLVDITLASLGVATGRAWFGAAPLFTVLAGSPADAVGLLSVLGPAMDI